MQLRKELKTNKLRLVEVNFAMINCSLYEEIYKGQFQKQKYTIWSIMGRESELAYWYVVMFDKTYKEVYCSENIDLDKIDDKITDKAIDIRKLPSYKEASILEIFHYRKVLVVPLIKEAIKKGDIKPL